jgi:hypothetical protein
VKRALIDLVEHAGPAGDDAADRETRAREGEVEATQSRPAGTRRQVPA